MSRSTAAHSITKMWVTEVKPVAASAAAARSVPSPWTLMSMAAWPSIDPATPRSACCARVVEQPLAEEEPEQHGHARRS